MAPSYKPLWQEAQEEIARLKSYNAGLSSEIARLRAAIDASPNKLLRELERIRVVVDLAGIARHMRVGRHTPLQWRQRDLLPEVDFPEIKEPLWYASTIRDGFAMKTRRLWYDNPDEELWPAA